MSHGHDHKDYKRVFGNVERSTKGLIVLCDGEAPKAGTDVRQQVRAVCLGRPLPACETCEHSHFTIQLKPKIGDQLVACPRWPSIVERYAHEKPSYEMVRRQQCIIDAPYEYCSFCPNRNVNDQPRTQLGWWEAEKWKE
jgi:hypothetical protein